MSPYKTEYRPIRARVSLTPLIDVVFILLVFFMLASTFMEWRSFDLNVAASQTRAALDQEPPLRVTINADGRLSLDGQRLAMAQLQQQLAAHIERKPDTRVLLEPASGVKLQSAIDVLDRLRAGGARQVSLVSGESNP